MSTIVLVHGAWSGAHGFRKLRPLLREAGHDVFTPGLTGIGERSHLSSPMINLTTHTHDVVNAILYEDLTDVLLLGFSYGGMVVSNALRHIDGRVRQLVYLDAFVPSDGDSADRLRGATKEATIELDQAWTMPPLSRAMDDPADVDWFGPRRSPQPRATFAEPAFLPVPVEDYSSGLSYIKATADDGESQSSAFWQAARMARDSDRWNYYEVATNHMVAINRPRELADILIEIDSSDARL